MKTTLESDRPLEPGVELKISERDEVGCLVGYYKGFWKPDTGTVDLYPTHNPYCWWRVPRVKHSVSEFLIKVSGPVRTLSGANKSATVKTTPKKKEKSAEGIKPSTAKAMKELIGQKKFDF